ncbi:hypothetical protein [Tardiphaga sp.]|jgi:hypothetical protein|uniref:hypothetical protein n=1 Tax=Tardiphaga sp. TaxID=1926292 RepID=UPI0037DA42BF
MATIDVKDAGGSVVPIEKPLAPGRAAAALSRPVALSTEDKASVDAISTALSTLGNYLDQVEALIGSTNTGLSSVLAKLSADPATQTTLAAILAKLNSSVAVTGTFWQATQPISAASLPLPSGAATAANQVAATPAGTNLIGRVAADASAATGGISSTSRILSAAASTNATSAKASSGRLYAIQGFNASSFVRYLKLYNKASSPTVGTDTPVKTLALPPNVGFAFDWPHGYSFATGIAFALTAGSADNDTTNVTAGDILGLNLDYV